MGTQDEIDELTKWAEEEAVRLRQLRPRSEMGSFEYGLSVSAAALEFLRRNAPGSRFSSSAERLFEKGSRLSAVAAVGGVAAILDDWARSTRESWAQAQPFEVQARIEAATDLMEQVQLLIADRTVHCAAPIVLAGAALEEFLRSRVIAKALPITGKAGINSYADALQADGDLSKQEKKDITAWAGLRNAAAHGEFEELSRERAHIMVDGINLFLQKRT